MRCFCTYLTISSLATFQKRFYWCYRIHSTVINMKVICNKAKSHIWGNTCIILPQCEVLVYISLLHQYTNAKVCNKCCNCHMGEFKRIRKHLNWDTAISVVDAPKLEVELATATPIDGIPEIYINKLQNYLACIIRGRPLNIQYGYF